MKLKTPASRSSPSPGGEGRGEGEPAREIGPFSSITFMERQARITPGAEGRSCLVAAATPLLDDGQPLFLPVGPDLPPGLYNLEIKVTAESPRWLSLSRTSPGVAEKVSLLLQMREN